MGLSPSKINWKLDYELQKSYRNMMYLYDYMYNAYVLMVFF